VLCYIRHGVQLPALPRTEVRSRRCWNTTSLHSSLGVPAGLRSYRLMPCFLPPERRCGLLSASRLDKFRIRLAEHSIAYLAPRAGTLQVLTGQVRVEAHSLKHDILLLCRMPNQC